MRRRAATLAALAALAALALPAAALAHASLLSTFPRGNVVLSAPPPEVRLVYSEAVEPRFAIVSVTDAAGRQTTSGPPRRSPANPDELDVPLKKTAEGWYLVFWRVISEDGHPVRGAFTFAVGPNPGPAPQFVIPSTSETAATVPLLIARWVSFLAVMAAIGLLVLRTLIARPVLRRVRETSLRGVAVAFGVAIVVALVAIPIYVEMATAKFALRSVWDVGAVVPLARASAFGRGWLDLELVTALLAIAGGAAIWLDRNAPPRRTVAALLALVGALWAAAAALVVPGVAGHAATTSPRGLSLVLDWLHLAAGSVWIGGLIGVLVFWRSLSRPRRVAGLAIVVPRFSNAAFWSVMALLGSGIGASLVHFPTLASLWTTSYGDALLVKIGLLLGALLLAAVNLARTKPRLEAGELHPDLSEGAAVLLRRLVSGEVLLSVGALFAAAVLSSLPPPPKALAQEGKAVAHVGPGPVNAVVQQGGYRLAITVQPNRAAVPNAFAVRVERGGQPVRRADVTLTFAMLDMEMGTQAYRLPEVSSGLYRRSSTPALVMVGHWGLTFDVRPPGGQPIDVLLVDRANG
jgi:copper transport protein